MEKIVIVPEKVEDLYGLYMDLRKSEFAVKNVGRDNVGTYVHIDEAEMKDPVPIVKSWIGKKTPEMTLSLKKKRLAEYEELLAKEKAVEEKRKAEAEKLLEEGRLAELMASTNTSEMGVQAVAFEDSEGNVIGELLGDKTDEDKKDGFFGKLWKKLF